MISSMSSVALPRSGGAPVPNVYEIVAEKLIKEMEQGTCPWRKPWVSVPSQNFVSGKPYRGINRLLLAGKAAETGCPYFATFKQVKELGGKIKKGATSEIAVFFKMWRHKEDEDRNDGIENSTPAIPLLRYYRLFSLAQTEGIDWEIPDLPNVDHEPHDRAETIVQEFLKDGGPESRIGGDRASYSPHLDSVRVPSPETFKNSEAYYGTLFHELIHSTGHSSRLSREDLGATFGSKKYAREELTAEIGSSFLLATCGLLTETETENSSAYLRGWIQELENHPRTAVIAANRAEKAADWVLGIRSHQEEELPQAA